MWHTGPVTEKNVTFTGTTEVSLVLVSKRRLAIVLVSEEGNINRQDQARTKDCNKKPC
jgi:hypothetical protein